MHLHIKDHFIQKLYIQLFHNPLNVIDFSVDIFE